MSKIIFYDLPSNDGNHSWSLNPWKTRLALNYKNVDYTTEWVEYPDLAPKFKELGVTSNKDGAEYTIPIVSIGGKYIMDSRKIAPELEKQFPEPSLHLDAPILARVEEVLPKATTAFYPAVGSLVPGILPPRSAEYFERTRAQRFGMSLAELNKTKGGEAALNEARPHLRELAAMLKESGGPFFMGDTVSYADFYVVGFLQFVKRLGAYDKVVSVDPVFEKLYEASSKWLERDDY